MKKCLYSPHQVSKAVYTGQVCADMSKDMSQAHSASENSGEMSLALCPLGSRHCFSVQVCPDGSTTVCT